MRLGIISDCTHYTMPDGSVGTENHILLRQFQQLCSHFDTAIICCPFAPYDSSKVVTTYSQQQIDFLRLPIVGGNTLKEKFKLFGTIPTWWKAYRILDYESDVVYQRFPNNVNIPGFWYFWLKKKRVFATYTGTWKAYKAEPFTYKLQRWMLRRLFRGPVWVYSDEITANDNIFPGFSPSYNAAEWREETEQVERRIKAIREQGVKLLRMITVGTLIRNKNQIAILRACNILRENGLLFHLTIVGDGPMKDDLARFIQKHDLEREVELVGKKNHVELRQLYREHDFVVQAPLKEGFGKVPVEGFFHGLIPVLNNVGMAAYITGRDERGFLFDASGHDSLATTLGAIRRHIEWLPQMIINGREFSRTQTLEHWAENYHQKIIEYFNDL